MSIEVRLNEYGDTLDEPYVVRAVKDFTVPHYDWWADLDRDIIVPKGSEWAIYGASCENDYLLESDCWALDLSQSDLDEYFELVAEGGYDDD